MSKGIEMMLKAAGVNLDFEKIGKDFEQLKQGVTETLQAINGKLTTIEQRQQKIEMALHLLLGDEKWKALQTMQQNSISLQLTAQQPQQ